MKTIFPNLAGLIAGVLTIVTLPTVATAADGGDDNVVYVARGDAGDPPPPPPVPGKPQVYLRTVDFDGNRPLGRDMTWLGVGVEESSEPLAAQLGLKRGEGLVVTYVSTNSPAAEAGLQKNDVLVELAGQMLVDPVQLRKLVQMHEDGESVKVVYFRAGKKESASAKLARHTLESDAENPAALPLYSREFRFQPNPLAGFARVDGVKVQADVQKAMAQAQLAVKSAMDQAWNTTNGVNPKLWTIHQKLGHLADGGMDFNKDSTVIVKNDGESVRTIVKKDQSGTYIVVADPAKHLTAHDPDGKLLFDGPIDTPEQQEKVLQEIWKKVQPMVDQLGEKAAVHYSPEPEDLPGK